MSVHFPRPAETVRRHQSSAYLWNARTELVQRLLADRCELCGSRQNIQVHHVRALKDLEREGRTEMPRWAREMAARRRKTLLVCRKCHTDIHAGRHQG